LHGKGNQQAKPTKSLEASTVTRGNLLNKYKVTFTARCPVNNKKITYNLQIKSEAMIRVEDLLAFVKQVNQGFHEEIADSLIERFGGQHILRAYHHGVFIETERGLDVPQ